MSMFGNTSTPNPLFGGKPTTSIFGSTNQANSNPNPLTNAPPLGATTQNQPSGTSIFGQQNQPQQQNAASGSLFGNTATTSQPTTSLFGNTANQQQPAGGTSLFGNTGSQQQQQPATGGSLFGSTTQPTQQSGTTSLFGNTGQQQTGSSLFGNTMTNAIQPQAGTTSLFGSTSTQPQTGTNPLFVNTGTQQTSGGTSLFGNTGTQQSGGSSLFGNTGMSGQQQQGSLFGNTGTTNQPQTGSTSMFGNTGTGTSSLYGSTTQQPQQQQSSLFGSTVQPAQSIGAIGTSSLFGAKPATPIGSSVSQPTQPGQQAQAGQFSFTKSTKFNDLPDGVKHLLESIDSHIQGRVQISKDLHQRKLGEEPTRGQDMIKQMQKELLNASNVTRSDLRHTEDLKAKVDQAMQDTIVASRIIDAFRNPQSGTTYLKDHAGFPLEFFQRVTQQMVERLTWYKTTIEQIERKLSSSAGQVQTPQSIAATLQAQNATFLALASKTAALEAELQKVKVLYTQLWRAKTGSVRDPFNEGDRLAENPGDLGFGGLGVK